MVPPAEEVTVSWPSSPSSHLHWLPHMPTRPSNSSRSLPPQTLQVQVRACRWCSLALGIGGPSPIKRRALPWLQRWWQMHGRRAAKRWFRVSEPWSKGCMGSIFGIQLGPNTCNNTHCLGSSLCLLALDNCLSPPTPNVGMTGGTSSTQVRISCLES
jgi:hypothetical protein